MPAYQYRHHQDRLARVDTVALGYPGERRRTQGLRREEVAQRAHISATWDLLAWNRAAAAVFGYDRFGAGERNILRRIFCDPRTRAAQRDWPGVARFAVAGFRSDTARAGASAQMQALVQELSQASPEFDRLWREQEVISHGEGSKRLRHPVLGEIALEYTALAIDGRSDLCMVVFIPVTAEDATLVRLLIAQTTSDA